MTYPEKMEYYSNREKNRREFYRIHYPLRCRPGLTFRGQGYEIIDLSETGVRFHCPLEHDFKPGLEIQVTITFHDNASIECKGKILRIDGQTAALLLHEPVALERIIQEQRYIRAQYPDYYKT